MSRSDTLPRGPKTLPSRSVTALASVWRSAARPGLSPLVGLFLARPALGAPRPHHAAGAPGAARIGRELGVAEPHLHVSGIEAKAVRGDLRQRRLQSLADALDPRPDFKPAIGSESCKGLLVERAPLAVGRGPGRRLLGEDRDAEPDQPPVR